MSFAGLLAKQVEATFDGGILTSNSGVMLIREVDAESAFCIGSQGLW